MQLCSLLNKYSYKYNKYLNTSRQSKSPGTELNLQLHYLGEAECLPRYRRQFPLQLSMQCRIAKQLAEQLARAISSRSNLGEGGGGLPYFTDGDARRNFQKKPPKS